MNPSPAGWPLRRSSTPLGWSWPAANRSVIAGDQWPVTQRLYQIANTNPSLDLEFARTKTLKDTVTGRNLVTFTRTQATSTGSTYVAADGLIKTAASNEPRFDHNPTTGESLGLLVEEARTNLLLNSATLSTQSVTVAAAANTLSFYGTGTVTLTGVSTAGPLVGTGANNRVSLTFTPTVGVLVLTVSGSVTNAQLEAGAFPTSYIPTTTATVTRAADVASITGLNFSSFYDPTVGSLMWLGQVNAQEVQSQDPFRITEGSSTRGIAFQIDTRTGNIASTFVTRAAASGFATANNPATISLSDNFKFTGAYKVGDYISVSYNGGNVITSTNLTNVFGTEDRMEIGGAGVVSGTSAKFNGLIKRIIYWPTRLSNNVLQQLAKL